MTQAVIYTRVSSREQQQEGFSLDAQEKLLREYANRNGIQVVKAFEDVETAKATGRRKFDEMMTHFKRNRSCRVLLVEKTDRLYRNLRDAVTVEDLDIEVHLVKESQILSKDSKSQAKLIHGIHLVMARNYSENLREEVKKGMAEKASQGVFPGHAPFGYRNNKAERNIEIDPIDSITVKRVFELYATGAHTLSTLRKKNMYRDGKTDQSQQRSSNPHKPVLHRVLCMEERDVSGDASGIRKSEPFRSGASSSCRSQQTQIFETRDSFSWLDELRL